MRNSWKIVALAASASLALTACGGSGDASGDGSDGADVSLTVATFDPEHSALSQSITAWMEEVEERSDGRIAFEPHWNGALCGPTDMNDCVRDGIADIGFSSPGYAPGDYPLAEMASIGFLSADMQGASDALQQVHDEIPEMQEEFASANQKLLFFSPAGAHAIALNQEIDELSDMEGLSIRATGGQTISLDELGANPVNASLGEAYESIERGVLDGGSFAPELAAQIRIYEVAPHIYDTAEYHGGVTQMMWTINQTRWDSLDAELQDAIEGATEAVQPVIAESFLTPTTEEVCQTMIDEGAVFHEIGPESDGEAWKENAQARLEENWTSNAQGSIEDPAALLDRYKALIEENDSGDHRTGAEICMEFQD